MNNKQETEINLGVIGATPEEKCKNNTFSQLANTVCAQSISINNYLNTIRIQGSEIDRQKKEIADLKLQLEKYKLNDAFVPPYQSVLMRADLKQARSQLLQLKNLYLMIENSAVNVTNEDLGIPRWSKEDYFMGQTTQQKD